MSYFINFDPLTGFSISTYCKPDGIFCDDVAELIGEAVTDCPACCPLDGALDALQDGSLWNDDDQPTVELLHFIIREWEAA